MKATARGALLWSCLLAGQAGGGEARPVPAQRATIRFDEQLGLSDLRLRAGESERIRFALERGWRPVDGSALHLFLERPDDPETATPPSLRLSIALNQQPLRSVVVGGTSASGVVIPLPAARLARGNELTLTPDPAPAQAPGAELVVRAQSFVAVAYTQEEPSLALSELPLPLLDPDGYRPQTLTLLLPASVSTATLEAAGLLVSQLANRISPRPLRIVTTHALEQVRGALLVIGTPLEQPNIDALLDGTPFGVERGRPDVRLRGPAGPLPPGSGVVGLRSAGAPWPHTALFLTADTPEGLRRAAASLFDDVAQLTDPVALIRPSRERLPLPERVWRGHAPPGSRFRLADLGYRAGDLVLSRDAPVRVPIRTTPDARFLSDAHRVTLHLPLLPELLSEPGAQIEVLWNDAVLKRFPVASLSRPLLSAAVPIAASLLTPHNELGLRVTGARGTDGRAPLALVAPETAFYLPRAYSARLPDLALLASSLFPLSLRADLSDVVVVVPDAPGGEMLELVCEVAALCGRLAPGDRFAFRVRRAMQLGAGERAFSHLVLLEAGGGRSLIDSPGGRPPRETAALHELPVLEEFVSPWNPRRVVLRLRAPLPADLSRALRQLREPGLLARLVGDTAFLSGSGPVCYRSGSQRVLEDVGLVTLAEAWLRTNWLAPPVLATALGGAMLVGLRRGWRRRKAGRHATRRPVAGPRAAPLRSGARAGGPPTRHPPRRA